jgi:hypothetical protein
MENISTSRLTMNVAFTDRQTWSSMEQGRRLRVEVYAHGGWWKDSTGQSGQVPPAQANRGPMATVAAVSNSFGTDGWKLTEVVSGHHTSYHLSFERAPEVRGADGDGEPLLKRAVVIHSG